MLNKTIYIVGLFLLISLVGVSQPHGQKYEIEDADEHFKHGNFVMALPIYKEFVKKDPSNKRNEFRLAQCYINTNYNRTEAIKYLEDIVKADKIDDDAWLYMGRAYSLGGKIEDAIKAFEKYKELFPKKTAIADRYIEMCNNARTLMDNPVNISFTNMGKEINSDEPDYYPFVSGDETFMAFTSRRKDNIGGKKVEVDGYHPSDIYFSKLENGKWTKALNAGAILNSPLDEEVVGMKTDGSELMVYIDHIDKFGDLYLSTRKANGEFQKGKPLPAEVNTKVETSGSFGPDGNVIVFARRKDVDSKSDIFMSRKLPNGVWGVAYKLPPEINTAENEDFPFLSSDGVTLYFSSEGHNSMGGYDLFKSIWNPEENTWTKAENLGFPINSTDNDRSISLTPDNRVGYISAFRPGGQGDLDIYRIRFNNNDQVVRFVTGKVWLNDTIIKERKPPYATIIAKNKDNNNEYHFTPHSKTGKFVMALDAGTYHLIVHCDGFSDVVEDFTVSDLGSKSVEPERIHNYILKEKNPKSNQPEPKDKPKPKK